MHLSIDCVLLWLEEPAKSALACSLQDFVDIGELTLPKRALELQNSYFYSMHQFCSPYHRELATISRQGLNSGSEEAFQQFYPARPEITLGLLGSMFKVIDLLEKELLLQARLDE